MSRSPKPSPIASLLGPRERLGSPATPCSRPKGVYRPRRPRANPLFKILSDHAAGFLENYEHEYAPKWGRLRDVVQRSFEAFLECGLPEYGFARVRCGTCHDEYLLPFSCQIRGLCTSCSAKRCAAFGKWVTEELVREVPHQHVVVGLPKMLRPYFKYRRYLLTDLAGWVYECLQELMSGLAPEAVRPGVVMTLQPAGNLLDLNPHLHCLVTAGAFDAATGSTFYRLPKRFWRCFEELVRRKVLGELRERKLISEKRMKLLLSWRHSGFSVFVGDPIPAENKKNLERLARYLKRLHVAESRIVYSEESGQVIVSSGKAPHPKHKANFRLFKPREFLAHLAAFMPDPYRHESIAYGEYSNAARGKRRRQDGKEPLVVQTADPTQVSSSWQELMKRIYEVDPLVCNSCGGQMRLVAAITDSEIVRRILSHLGLWPPPARRAKATTPRAPPPQIEAPLGFLPPSPDEESQVPAWWEDERAFSQVPPDEEVA